MVLCGDFNICHRPIDIHHPDVAEKRKLSGFLPEEREWMNRFVELGFVDAFRNIHGDVTGQYSWWTFRAGARGKNLGWRIDYFFLGKKIADRLRSASIHQSVMGSDHCPISIELS
ncbi:MAG: endonuclease/exonuclease/phosphatase family protein [Bdellovibrionales bacterium]|nr:endonuclease/exonuclease/phosphatase family protein [Bdellovibrionales bacterium]